MDRQRDTAMERHINKRATERERKKERVRNREK